jgi:hypothetical protein
MSFNHNGLLAMFVDPKHIHDNSNFEDDGFANGHDEGVIDIGGIEPMDESFPPTNDVGACVKPISLVCFLDRTFVHLRHTM